MILQQSSDRGRDRYGDEEQKFDILSPELQQKLENVIGVSNPKAINFVDTFGCTSENIFSAPASHPGRLRTSGVNKYEIWIMFKKKGQKKSLADLNQNNKTKTIYIPGDTSHKWEVEINTLDYFCRPKSVLTSKSVLNLASKTEGERIEKAETEARKKHAENISKASKEALEEINQTLSGCSMDIGTAEIDWMDVLPDYCSCEIKGYSENNTLHQRHIQKCLWREESEIKAFKDKMIAAILSKGGTKFKDYKNWVIQEIIQKAQSKGISEAQLNNNRPNWQNTLLSLNSPKDITDYRTNHLEKYIENLVASKNKSAEERQQAEKEAQENAKKEEERLKKEREKKEQETKNQAEEQAKQQKLKQRRDEIVSKIISVLNQDPKLTNGDLNSQYQNWQEKINQINN